MARQEPRSASEKNDTEEVRAISEQIAEVTARAPAEPEVRARVQEAKAKSRFVREVVKSVGASKQRVSAMPFSNEVVIPMDEHSAEAAFDAQLGIREYEVAEQQIAAEELARESTQFQYFLRCRHCYGHGIYLVRPTAAGARIGDGDWYARYKPDPKTVWRQKILCQVCLSKGEGEIDMPVFQIDWRKGTFTPEKRWLRKVSKDPVTGAKYGSQRSGEMDLESQNILGGLVQAAPAGKDE